MLALLAGALAWAAYKVVVVLAFTDQLLPVSDILDPVQLVIRQIGAVPWIAAAALGLVWLSRRGVRAPRLAGGCLAACALAQATAFALPRTEFYRDHFAGRLPDMRFAHEWK